MTCLPLCRLRAESHHIYHKLCQSVHGLHESNAIQEDTYILNCQIMSYILNMLIRVDIILLDNMLQYFLFIVVIDISSQYYKG
jgi:hypothetical protein